MNGSEVFQGQFPLASFASGDTIVASESRTWA